MYLIKWRPRKKYLRDLNKSSSNWRSDWTEFVKDAKPFLSIEEAKNFITGQDGPVWSELWVEYEYIHSLNIR